MKAEKNEAIYVALKGFSGGDKILIMSTPQTPWIGKDLFQKHKKQKKRKTTGWQRTGKVSYRSYLNTMKGMMDKNFKQVAFGKIQLTSTYRMLPENHLTPL